MKKVDAVLLPTGAIAAAVYPLIFVWMNNVNMIKETGEILQNIAILAVCATALFGLLALCFRNLQRAAFAAIAIILIFENGALLQSGLTVIMPYFRYWHTATILLIIAGIVIYLVTKLKMDVALKISKGAGFVFIGLVCLNIAMAVPKIASASNAAAKEQDQHAQVQPVGSGRNMYWLLFDNYSSNFVYKKYFNFDNSDFTGALEDMGFNVSYTSENDAIHTVSVTANIANLAYITDFSKARTYLEAYDTAVKARETAAIIPLAESHGYEVVGIGSAEYYGYTGKKAATQNGSGMTLEGDSAVSLFWKRTVLMPFMSINVNGLAAEMLSQLRYLQNNDNIPQSNTFVIAHFNTPHTPYLFMADGSLIKEIPDADTASRINPTLYTEQSQFAASEALKIVGTIIENDPDAIIALTSDHAYKGPDVTEYNDRRRIFAALYNGGASTDIEGMSGMNIMITMINEALGTAINYVDLVVQEEAVFQ